MIPEDSMPVLPPKVPPKPIPRPKSGPCGGCSFTFNVTDGCYHRQSNGCTGGCSCPPLICGLGSLLLQLLRPDSLQPDAIVGMSCSSAATPDEWCARALHEMIFEMTNPTAPA
jgi:hypothetical protein